MKFIDNLVMIIAGYSLYTVVMVFSSRYFANINHLIPDFFSPTTTITLGQTFHHVLASLFTGFLLVRFGSFAPLLAFIVAITINVESYIIIMTDNSVNKIVDYYLANPMDFLNLLKPLIILPLFTYLLSLIKGVTPEEKQV
ncbi:MAG: hypothetical protein GY781_11035 [Gammaproteobacteria bacterium]|nr:hypothetical protein [Gammaproteobacteria bacterium]